MNNTADPEVSIVMPVFNTGRYLCDAIKSVLNQQATSRCSLPSFELIMVDDGSTDPETLEILRSFSQSDSRIVCLQNRRRKGPAGARNTGIAEAKGAWVGFIDSDDIWMPTSLAWRWDCTRQHPEARWVAGRFRFLKPGTDKDGKSTFKSQEKLWGSLDRLPAALDFSCLRLPVKAFGDGCIIGTTTVLIRRDLIVAKGMFNEFLRRAEDYYLWFRCAFGDHLWMTQSEVSFYRIHSASLTHGDSPRLLDEEKMIELLLNESDASPYKDVLIRRYDLVMQDICYFYREKRSFGEASRTALQWIGKRPFKSGAWKELVACCLRMG